MELRINRVRINRSRPVVFHVQCFEPKLLFLGALLFPSAGCCMRFCLFNLFIYSFILAALSCAELSYLDCFLGLSGAESVKVRSASSDDALFLCISSSIASAFSFNSLQYQ